MTKTTGTRACYTLEFKKEAVKLGAVDRVLPLGEIHAEILRTLQGVV